MRISDWSSDVCSSDLLVEVPAPLPEPTHVRGPLFSDLAGHHSRTVSWQMSIPRSNSRSSTFRSDSGYFRSEEHTSELQSLMRISYAVFCLKNKKSKHTKHP